MTCHLWGRQVTAQWESKWENRLKTRLKRSHLTLELEFSKLEQVGEKQSEEEAVFEKSFEAENESRATSARFIGGSAGHEN